jgi:hypothetical protein
VAQKKPAGQASHAVAASPGCSRPLAQAEQTDAEAAE